jgi:hypothetical protein
MRQQSLEEAAGNEPSTPPAGQLGPKHHRLRLQKGLLVPCPGSEGVKLSGGKVVHPRTWWTNRNLAAGEKPPATPRELHREHHRHRDTRNKCTEAIGRRCTEGDDRKDRPPQLQFSGRCLQEGERCRSTAVVRSENQGFLPHSRVVVQSGITTSLREGERRRWCRPRHGQHCWPLVSPVPTPTPPHLPNTKIRRPETPRSSNRQGDAQIEHSNLQIGRQRPAPHASSTASTPPARPERRVACTPAAGPRRADAVHATRGCRPDVPGPSRSRCRPQPQPPPTTKRWQAEPGEDGREEVAKNQRPTKTSSLRNRLPPYHLAGSSALRSPPPPSRALRAFAGGRLRGRRGRGRRVGWRQRQLGFRPSRRPRGRDARGGGLSTFTDCDATVVQVFYHHKNNGSG